MIKLQQLVWLISSLFVLSACSSDERWYTDAQVQQGKPLYEQTCMACHGAKAAGLGEQWQKLLPGKSYPPPALNGDAHAWHHPTTVLLETINKGGVPIGGYMPAFADSLSEDEKLAIIAYFQSFWPDKQYGLWKQVNEQNK